jgi:hypothetical protein
MNSPALSRFELELRRIREVTNGRRHGEALAAAETLAVAAPANRDVLYLIAINVPIVGTMLDTPSLEVL